MAAEEVGQYFPEREVVVETSHRHNRRALPWELRVDLETLLGVLQALLMAAVEDGVRQVGLVALVVRDIKRRVAQAEKRLT